MRIAILVYNSFENDARVEKALATYMAAGHEAHVVALAPPRHDPKPRANVTHIRVWPGRSLSARIVKGAWLPLRNTVAAAGLWLTWRQQRRTRSPTAKGRGAVTLYRFAHRINGYRRFALSVFEKLQAAHLRPDVVHANDFNTLPAAELLNERLGIPFIYDSHELWSGRNRGHDAAHPLEADWELAVERRIARKAAAMATVSPSIARHLSQLLEVPEPAVIRNLPYASALRATRGLRQILGLAADTKLLVYTGKATYNRGLEEVLEALAALPRDFHLLVLGNFDVRFRALFEAKVAGLDLRARIHHYGPVPSEEVPFWASEGDLCLVPIKGVCLSYEYCLPNKLFEGIQAGLPVLATNLVEMKRTLEEYDCGLTYESGNVADLKAKIEYILGTPGVAERLRSNAAKAARRLNWETEKVRLIALLDAMPRAAEASRA